LEHLQAFAALWDFLRVIALAVIKGRLTREQLSGAVFWHGRRSGRP
jgi:hypothetical protein